MIVDRTASSVLADIRLIDDEGNSIAGVAFDSPDLSWSYATPTGGWVEIPILDMEIGTYIDGGWAERGGGIYQVGVPDEAIIAGKRTLLRVIYGDNDPQYDVIDALTSISSSGGSGEGVFSVPLTIKAEDGTPLGECDVTVTTSPVDPTDGFVASQTTRYDGTVIFDLNPGTYYLWRQKDGVVFNNPATINVSETGVVT